MAYVQVNQKGDVLTEHGYGLPPFLLRLASAAIDAAFFAAAFWVVFFFSYSCSWYPTLREGLGIVKASEEIYSYQVASCLLDIDADGRLSDKRPTSYLGYEKAIKDYYFVYNSSSCAENPAPRNYSIDDYNRAVCDLPNDVAIRNQSQFYDFPKNESGEPVLGQFAVLKSSCFDSQGNLTKEASEGLLGFYRTKYYKTQDLLLAETYYKKASDSVFYGMIVVELLSSMLPFLAFYVVIPAVSPYNRSLGKKFMHLCVIDVLGIPLRKWQLALRSIPFVLTVVFGLFLNEVVYSIGLFGLVFLISWGCASFTKKKRALHDFVAHSVVVREDPLYLVSKTPEGKGDSK